jgi:hypothetical protein
MKRFKDFNIKSKNDNFSGEKVKINKILDKEIIIENFKINPSKIRIGTEFLIIKIIFLEEERIIISGSKNLIQMIQEVKKEDFPFLATITKKGEMLEFI